MFSFMLKTVTDGFVLSAISLCKLETSLVFFLL